ncbi:MAG: hypothetical protein M0R33_13955 [Methylomonas sp.]|jgi:hypothetical protein|uniref:hypothetical protein n=1 Tax=Methylomonas sp. TaxID=418 RepID=UPI0025E385AD|nr:hypothetical protein [Methylomonas sp.]MCK9607540.1 hypothetical protein [Methylomonas sp.]
MAEDFNIVGGDETLDKLRTTVLGIFTAYPLTTLLVIIILIILVIALFFGWIGNKKEGIVGATLASLGLRDDYGSAEHLSEMQNANALKDNPSAFCGSVGVSVANPGAVRQQVNDYLTASVGTTASGAENFSITDEKLRKLAM